MTPTSVRPAKPSGHIKISRKAYRGDPWWTEARVFSRWEAWEDCIQMASYRDATRSSRAGDAIFLARGEFVASLRFLAQRWGWGVKQVRGFVTIAARMGRFRAQRETPLGTVYLIVNYDRYQSGAEPEGTPEGTARAHLGHRKGTKKKQLSSTHTPAADADDASEPPDEEPDEELDEQLDASPARQELLARFETDAERAALARFLAWLPATVSREGWVWTIAGFFDGLLLAGLRPATPAAVAAALTQFTAQQGYALTPRNVARFVERELAATGSGAERTPAPRPTPAAGALTGAVLRPIIEAHGLTHLVTREHYWRAVDAACPAGVDPALFRDAIRRARPWTGFGGLTFPRAVEQEIDARLAATASAAPATTGAAA